MRYRRWIAAPAVLAAAVMGLGGCSQREATIVDQAFKNPVSSAQMTLHMSLDGKSIFDVQGPFKSNGDKQLPSFDWDVKAPGGLKGRVVSSGKNVFVTYQGTTYAVGEDKIAKMLRRQDSSDDVGSLSELQSRFGIDLKQWFPQTSTKEDAQAAGVPTTRVSGKVDVDRVVDDFGRLMRSPEFKKQAGPGAATLPPQALDQLKQAVSDARFSLDVGRDDHKLRQVAVSLRTDFAGKAHRLGFVVTLRDVDKPVSIDAPTSGRPIEELLQKLGGKELKKAA